MLTSPPSLETLLTPFQIQNPGKHTAPFAIVVAGDPTMTTQGRFESARPGPPQVGTRCCVFDIAGKNRRHARQSTVVVKQIGLYGGEGGGGRALECYAHLYVVRAYGAHRVVRILPVALCEPRAG